MKVPLKESEWKNLRRNRPLNPLKAKCREVAVGSRRKASQVGERANESRGETLLSSQNPQGENGRTKSLEEISRSSESHWISQRCKVVTTQAWRGFKAQEGQHR
jgi:hypothetical protein